MRTVLPELKVLPNEKKGKAPPKATISWASVSKMNRPSPPIELSSRMPASLRGVVGLPVSVNDKETDQYSLFWNRWSVAPPSLEKRQSSRLAKPVSATTFCSLKETSE